MFDVTASYSIHETYSGYNDWETTQYETYGDALHAMLDIFGNPDHGCEDDWVNEETGEHEWFYSHVNYHRGVFLIKEGHTNWSGNEDNVEWKPVPKCRPAVLRP